MNSEIYYHILEIGVVYEKGGKQGTRWRMGEKKRLLDECWLWRNLIQYASLEEKGVDCAEKAFSDLEKICKKHAHLCFGGGRKSSFPCYERALSMREELTSSTRKFVVWDSDKNVLIGQMLKEIDEIEKCVSNRDGKADAYRAMQRLHNMPKVLHGDDELGR